MMIAGAGAERRGITWFVSSALLVLSGLAMAVGGCGGTVLPVQYAEYKCPEPIGVIIRDDCSQATLKFQGFEAGGGVSAGPVSIQADYHDKVLRQADDAIVALKQQYASLCNNWNTCKLTREDYNREQSRIDGSFIALISIRESVAKMDAASAILVMHQISDLRIARVEVLQTVDPSHVGAEHDPPASAPTPASAAAPEWAPGKYMMQAVAGVADEANKLSTDAGWGYDIDGAAIMGAYVKTGAVLSFVTTFEGGREYAMIGQGSEGTKDLDLRVSDADSGAMVGQDTDNDATPVVHFHVPKTGNYQVAVQLAASDAAGEFVAVASMEKGGYTVPADDVIASLSRAVLASTMNNQKHGPLVFHESGNWSLYATVLKPSEASTYGGILLETGATIFLATADDHAKDINLGVKNLITNQEYADTDKDASPIVGVPSNGASQRHTVKLSNAASAGPSFVTLMLLDKKD